MKIELIDLGVTKLPQRAKPMDVGADVFAPDRYVLGPGETKAIPLGFGIRVPNGYAAFICPKSGLASRGRTCELSPIDPSYTGDIHAIVHNGGLDSWHIETGQKIGQLVIFPCIIADFVTEPLEERGANGFGSTGK